VINGMHVSAAHHALKNAFLTCLKCTHPGAAPVFLLYFNAYLMFLSEYLRVCLEKKLKIVVASQMLKTVFKYQLFKRIFRCGSPLPLTTFFFFFGKKKTTKHFSHNTTQKELNTCSFFRVWIFLLTLKNIKKKRKVVAGVVAAAQWWRWSLQGCHICLASPWSPLDPFVGKLQ